MSYLLDTDICSAFIKRDRQVGPMMMQYSGRLHVGDEHQKVHDWNDALACTH